MQEEVTAILDGWSEVRAQDFGAFWLVVGVDPYGTPRGGSREDALSLAADLRDIAEREKPAPLEQAPEPVSPVQPTDPVQVSASPVEVHEQPSTGDAAPQGDQHEARLHDVPDAGQAGTETAPAALDAPTETAAPVESAQTALAADEPPLGSASSYPGLMLQEDRENYLRGVITVRVTQIERNRLEARYDANARERQRVGFVEYHNASDLGLPITDDVRAAYEEFLAADAWVRATKDHADALRNAAITVGLDLLEAMQTSIEEGWP